MRQYPVALLSDIRLSAPSVEVVAHRGFGNNGIQFSVAPEDTMPAFTAAVGKAHSIKFDVHYSKDGHPMLMHDDTVDRTTTGTGAVSDLTRAELEALDAGVKFDARFAGTRIPHMSDVLPLVRTSFRYGYADLKAYRTLDDIRNFVQRLIDAGMEDRCGYITSRAADVATVREVSRRIQCHVYTANDTQWFQAIPILAADGNATIWSEQMLIRANPSRVTTARAQGVDVGAWTANTAADCAALAAIGITRIMSDNPDAITYLSPLTP